MIKYLTLTSLITTQAFAYETTANVTDVYRDVVRRIPHTEQLCETKQVPIYRGSNSNRGVTGAIVEGGFGSTDGLVGGIVGGLIGNQFGGGSGKDIATVAGVLIGSQVGNQKHQNNSISGYREVTECRNVTTYTERKDKIYSHTTITIDGQTFRVQR